MSFDKYKAIYLFYNNWFEIPNLFKDLNPIIELCSMSFENEEDLKKAIRVLIKNEFQSHSDLTEIQNDLSVYYAHSVGLSLIRLQNNLACLEDAAFEQLGIERKAVLQITVSIVFYYLMINVPDITEKLTKQQVRDYLGEGVTFDYSLLKKICWEIDESSFHSYMEMFALRITNDIGDNAIHEQLFCIGDRYLIFDIREFVRYIILQFEAIATEHLSELTIEKYRTKKAKRFEDEVFDLLKKTYPQTKRNMYYYVGDARNEIDIVIEDERCLLVGECKSGTVSLTYDLDERRILSTVYKKTKKANTTLNRFNEYYKNNERYTFVKGNKDVVLDGQCEKPLLLLNITMDAFETLSPNLENYLPSKDQPEPIILTISYEYLLAILLDCNNRGISILDYFLKRQSVKKRYPTLVLEINELDLYVTMTNKYGPSTLNDLLNNNSFEEFPNLRKAIASFHNEEGDEVNPSNKMIDEVDNYILSGYIPDAKAIAGINKKYIRLLHRLLDKQEIEHGDIEVPVSHKSPCGLREIRYTGCLQEVGT